MGQGGVPLAVGRGSVAIVLVSAAWTAVAETASDPPAADHPLALELKQISAAAKECPLVENLDAALRAHLPFVVPINPGSGRRADLSLTLTFQGGAWQLALRNSDDDIMMRRSLTLGPDLCRELAEACAIVVERFLRDVDWGTGSVTLAPTAPEVPSSSRAVERAIPEFHRFSVAAALAAVMDSRGDASGALVAEAALRLEHFQIAGRLVLNPETQVAANINGQGLGSLTTRRLSLELALGYCGGPRRWRWCLGPTIGLGRLAASASGQLYQFNPKVAWVPRAGGFARLGYEFWRDLEISAALTAAVPLRRVSFAIEGTTATYSTTSEGALSLGLGWLFF